MAALSVTTVVLSLTDGCPGLAFYILEVIINTSMILEVGIRFVALGRVRHLALCEDFSIDFTLSAAILEISIQHCRPNSHSILRPHFDSSDLCKMRCW
jgi:hypothetical protein